MAKWAAKPIDLGEGETFTPWVISLQGVPAIDNDEQAQADPELAVLSVFAHGTDRDVDKAALIAGAVLGSCSGLDAEREDLYFELTQLCINETPGGGYK